MNEQWGVGNKAYDKAFATTMVGDQKVELIHGEHAHSRCDNNTYARFPSGRVEGFDGHRILHDIRFRDSNYLKQSELSGDEVRKGGECQIFINGKQVDSFFYRDYERAMEDAKRRLDRIHEFCICLWDEDDIRKNLIGRKVYYREFPAIVKSYYADQAAIILLPDHPEGKLFPVPVFALNDGDDMDDRDSVKEDIYSPHIWWWRK